MPGGRIFPFCGPCRATTAGKARPGGGNIGWGGRKGCGSPPPWGCAPETNSALRSREERGRGGPARCASLPEESRGGRKRRGSGGRGGTGGGRQARCASLGEESGGRRKRGCPGARRDTRW